MRTLGLTVMLWLGLMDLSAAQVPTATPCSVNGLTQPITAATSAPTPVQVTSTSLTTQQYWLVNTGSVIAYPTYAATSAGATAACVVPDGTHWTLPPLTSGSPGYKVSAPPNSYFCAVTGSSTAVVMITPCLGN